MRERMTTPPVDNEAGRATHFEKNRPHRAFFRDQRQLGCPAQIQRCAGLAG
jgi:hypothetical protein